MSHDEDMCGDLCHFKSFNDVAALCVWWELELFKFYHLNAWWHVYNYVQFIHRLVYHSWTVFFTKLPRIAYDMTLFYNVLSCIIYILLQFHIHSERKIAIGHNFSNDTVMLATWRFISSTKSYPVHWQAYIRKMLLSDRCSKLKIYWY